MLRKWLLAIAPLCLPLSAGAAGVDGERIINADSEPGNWMSYGRTYAEERFSPLSSIDTETVDELGLAWSYDILTRTARGLEATPIVVDGVMYISTAWSHVVALDPVSGEELWEFDPQVDGTYAQRACCDVVNRGVAAWDGKIYIGAIDGRLIALDAKTGDVVWETVTVDQEQDYTITGAPRVVKGKVIIGNGGSEYGVRGYVSAYDAETGEMVWRFYTVPGDPALGFENAAMRMAADTWAGEWWTHGGGGTVWDNMAYDPELDLIYIGVGNGSPWNHLIRSDGEGDNLFLASIVALRPDTGEYVWHFQQVPAETWDYTATQHMILADLEIDGEQRKVLMQAPKNGFFYVIDRETGEFISGEPYVAVNWASGLMPDTGRPIVNQEARYYISGEPTVVFPAPLGGHNWHPMSFSPDTGLVYIPANEAAALHVPEAPEDFKRIKGLWNLGVSMDALALPEDREERDEVLKSVFGRLIAWDPIAQEARWTVDQPMIWNGGVLSTAGGLVFQGNAEGDFVAYRADTGERLWDFYAQTGIVAPPVSYEIDGEQYISVLAGWGTGVPVIFPGLTERAAFNATNRVLTFKLGGDEELPASEYERAPFDPPALTASPEDVAVGRQLYQRHCLTCHGEVAVGGGIVPDLRRSGLLHDPEGWSEIVLSDLLARNGMPNWSRHIDPIQAQKIRAFVIKRAQDAQAAGDP